MSDKAVVVRPFAPFEWMLSLRYLRARRKEGFISVIAGFSAPSGPVTCAFIGAEYFVPK